MKRPLVGLAILFALGIWVGSWTTWRLEWLWCGAAGLLAAFFIFRQKPVILFVLVFVAGMTAHRFATSTSSPRHVVNLLGRESQTAALRGLVIAEPTERGSFLLDVHAVQRGEAWLDAEGRLFVSVRSQPVPAYGDVIEFSARVREPETPRNPGAFDLRRWLSRQRVYLTATIWPQDFCTVVERGRGNRLVAMSLRLRSRLEAALHAGIEDEPGLAGVLAGMVIGERAAIPPDTYAAFQRTGMVHVFAVSGWNVALVTIVVVTALRVAQVPRPARAWVTMPLLVLYVMATGARPSAVRALVMACVWLFGWVLVRPVDLLNSMAAAALGILAFDPLQLFDGGFVLSFTVVVSLVMLTPAIEWQLQRWVAPDALVPEQLLPPWYQRWRRPGLTVVRWVSASVAAWVGLVPVLPVYFHLFTPISILGNVLAVPILGVITALGMVSLLAHPVWPWLAVTFNNANFALLHVLIRGVEWMAAVPGGHLFVQSPPGWMIAAYYGVLGLLLSKQLVRWRKWVLALTLVAVVVVMWWEKRREGVAITVLALNRGAAIFVNVPGEREDFLVDGGDDWGGAREVMPFLRSEGVDRLGAVVLTRGVKNHVAGLSAVAREIPVRQTVYSGIRARSRFYRQWVGEMQAQKIPLREVRTGEEWMAGDVRVRVLHPRDVSISKRSADHVVVMLLEYGPTRMLLLGDASGKVLEEIQETAIRYAPNVVVKGSSGSSWEETRQFLGRVQPAVAIVAAMPATAFHPRRELANSPVPLFRTDDDGAVTIRLAKDGYSVRTCLPAN